MALIKINKRGLEMIPNLDWGSTVSVFGFNLGPRKSLLLYFVYLVVLVFVYFSINRIPHFNYEVRRNDILNDSKICSISFGKSPWLSDKSQANFALLFPTDTIISIEISHCYKTEFSFFDVQPDTITNQSIVYKDVDKIDKIQKGGLHYYVKYPEMQNRQVVRSFIITALLALFLQKCFDKAEAYFEESNERDNDNKGRRRIEGEKHIPS